MDLDMYECGILVEVKLRCHFGSIVAGYTSDKFVQALAAASIPPVELY